MVKEDIEILEDMLMTLVDLLVENGIINQEEYDERVEKRVIASEKLTKFKDLKKK